MKQIAAWIDAISKDVENEALRVSIKAEVKRLCAKFPIYAWV
jgi:glycine/serine hydroxymethyltransferase